ncbi:MAG: DinB family protein [Ferruginibacter sp.]
MNLTSQIAAHIRQVHFGGNWTAVCLKEQLAGVNRETAVTKITGFNTIAALVFHINYYISAVQKVLAGGTLDAKDACSFEHAPIETEADWETLLNKTWADAESFANLIEKLPDSKLTETFLDEKYGNYYHNLHGILEHTHYHLGQIVMIKKILLK